MADKSFLLYSFLHAARGNWRNAFYIRCRECLYGQQPLCPGSLLAMDPEGRPVLMPVDLFRQTSGETIDVDECVATLDRGGFEALYAKLIEWTVSSPRDCPLLELSTRPLGRK